MQLPNVLKGFSLFVDGRGYAGKAESITTPKFAIKTESHRGGGMDGEVELDMGMDKMETSITIAEIEPNLMALLGTRGTLTARGSLEGPDGVQACILTMRGLWKEADGGEWKAGTKGALKMMNALTYCKAVIGGREVYEIDVPNGVRRIGGVDQLADRRQALGM
jgi:uncharacterized protein